MNLTLMSRHIFPWRLVIAAILLGSAFLNRSIASAEEPDILDLAKRKPLHILVNGRPAEYGDPDLAKAVEALKDLPHPWTVPGMIELFEKESGAWLLKHKQYEGKKNTRLWEGWERESTRCGYLATLLASSRDPRAAVVLCKTFDTPHFPGAIRAIEGVYHYFVNEPQYQHVPPEHTGPYATTNFYPEMTRIVKKWWGLNKASLEALVKK